MADECDFATDMQLKAADAFAAARMGRIALLPSVKSAEVCDCGAAISAARRAAVPGVTRCRFCQERAERQEAHRAR